ncbi:MULTISPECIES: helix-turn-helix domain-containing protein [unclassified Phaeobacter]|uniref:helix-turn-helix domain-containing protein n=1 Tax=unclassified Phaeobacter TaxID=2621772 RepID=UPI003A8945C9
MRQPTKQQLDRHERRRADLRVRGSSLAKIARELGVTDSAVTLVGKRMCRSAKIEQALADALQTTPEQIFPDLCEER